MSNKLYLENICDSPNGSGKLTVYRLMAVEDFSCIVRGSENDGKYTFSVSDNSTFPVKEIKGREEARLQIYDYLIKMAENKIKSGRYSGVEDRIRLREKLIEP